eukprot:SM000373S13611  [mRNA]  locus=s373:5618:6524:- [translate_table: standard]
MAKWGEGDPRWLVEDRDDGCNVNGWHWTEKNYTTWTRNRIQHMVKGVSVFVDDLHCDAIVDDLVHMDGEVVVNTRKGNKRFVMYDLTLTLSWSAPVLYAESGHREDVKGEIKLAEFANDNELLDYVYEVKVTGEGQAHDRLKIAMWGARDELIGILHNVLAELETMY